MVRQSAFKRASRDYLEEVRATRAPSTAVCYEKALERLGKAVEGSGVTTYVTRWTVEAEPSPTVTSNSPPGVTPAGRRMLTIAETAALMSFPSGYRWPSGMKVARRMIGNAVPPLLARQMAEVIKMHLGVGS